MCKPSNLIPPFSILDPTWYQLQRIELTPKKFCYPGRSFPTSASYCQSQRTYTGTKKPNKNIKKWKGSHSTKLDYKQQDEKMENRDIIKTCLLLHYCGKIWRKLVREAGLTATLLELQDFLIGTNLDLIEEKCLKCPKNLGEECVKIYETKLCFLITVPWVTLHTKKATGQASKRRPNQNVTQWWQHASVYFSSAESTLYVKIDKVTNSYKYQ